MIGYLEGRLIGVFNDHVIINVNGIGFNVFMPSGSITVLPSLNNEVMVYTHMIVREDAMTLYGFLNYDDLSFFKMLIGVSGVGPKFALGLLSTFSASELKLSILSMDAKTISKSPGIGLKSAQKIILELKDKISMEDVISVPSTNSNISSSGAAMNEAMQDAADALVALGYSATDALRAVRSCDVDEDDDVESILKQALRFMKR